MHGARGTIGSRGCFEVYSSVGKSFTFPIYPKRFVALEHFYVMFPSCHGPRSRMGWLGGEAPGAERATKQRRRRPEKRRRRGFAGRGKEVRSSNGIFFIRGIKRLGLVAARHGPGALVEECVPVSGGKGDGLFLLLCWLEAVSAGPGCPCRTLEHCAARRSGSPQGRRPFAASSPDYDLLQRKLQKLRDLPRHAEHVLALLEGAGQNLVSGENLIADFSQLSMTCVEEEL